jgi:hypothetical protein
MRFLFIETYKLDLDYFSFLCIKLIYVCSRGLKSRIILYREEYYMDQII